MGTVSVIMWYRGKRRAMAFAKKTKKQTNKKKNKPENTKKSSFFLLTQNRDGVGLFHWWGLI